MHTENDRYKFVQYGAHLVGPPTWLNFDASPTLRLQRLPLIGSTIRRNLPPNRPRFPSTVEYGDIVKGLPVEDEQCQAIYCSHVLEHLAYQDCRTALGNTFRYLEPGGLFRFVMPDLRALATAYLEYQGSDAAHRFMRRAHLGFETRPTSFAKRMINTLGNANHLWMWDYESMVDELNRQGFINIRRAKYGDSKEKRFDDVEALNRWEEPGFAEEGRIECLGIECERP